MLGGVLLGLLEALLLGLTRLLLALRLEVVGDSIFGLGAAQHPE
jgi:hypothetical protein